ncbi:MAG: hypothetical protein ACI906_001254 [Candidatus Latescibacterota bacterium]|jgi:hypothetical protein
MSTHRGLLHHMNINVSDMKRSSPFYDAVFRDLGYDLDDRRESGEDWKRWELDTPHEISIIQADKALGEQRFVRGRVGCFNHIAFFADTRRAEIRVCEQRALPSQEEGAERDLMAALYDAMPGTWVWSFQ